MARIHLSPPHVGPAERALILEAFDSNWIAPLGEHVDAFEAELAQYVGVRSAAALSSGTAALHLALLAAGVGPGDTVLVPSLTFAATAFAVTYVGAKPIFIDSEPSSWCVDPLLIECYLDGAAELGTLPRAVMTVDLYGQCADYVPILEACERHGVALIEDAAEALGAKRDGRAAGSFGRSAAFSFNGNKIITTSGGGMLVSDDDDLIQRARFLATQAREPALHYEHREIGFNYRMSNLLAALGRAQLQQLPERMSRRHEIDVHYRTELGQIEGLQFMPVPAGSATNAWLTVLVVDEQAFGAGPAEIISELARRDIEARPAWKPMHLQPVFADAPFVAHRPHVASEVFRTGVCLPTGSAMSGGDVERVIEGIIAARK